MNPLQVPQWGGSQRILVRQVIRGQSRNSSTSKRTKVGLYRIRGVTQEHNFWQGLE
jgi:hypothetical protein